MLLYGECDGVVDHAGCWVAVLATVIFWNKASDVVESRVPPEPCRRVPRFSFPLEEKGFCWLWEGAVRGPRTGLEQTQMISS